MQVLRSALLTALQATLHDLADQDGLDTPAGKCLYDAAEQLRESAAFYVPVAIGDVTEWKGVIAC